MDKLKQYVIFTVLGCLVVLAAGWFVLVSPKRSDAADLRNTAAQVASQNSQLQTQLTILKAQAKALPKVDESSPRRLRGGWRKRPA